MIQRTWLRVDGARLALSEAGACRPPPTQVPTGVAGPPLVFVHGWADSWVVWLRSLQHWGDRYHCVALDQPGHGHSALIPLPEGARSLAAHLAQGIRQLCEPPVTLIGHSLGGLLALRLVLDAPTLVARLVLVNPAWSGRLAFPLPLLQSPTVGVPTLRILTHAHRLALNVMAPLLWRGSAAQRDQAARWAAFHEATPAWLHRTMRLALTDLSAEVGTVQQPTLVLVGPRDRTVPPRASHALAARLPHGRALSLPGTGHHPMEDDFPAFRAAVDAFLTSDE